MPRLDSIDARPGACLTYLQALIIVCFNIYDHPWAIGLGTFLLDYAAREVQLETLQVRDPQYRNLGHALIVRHVQLRFSLWLQGQWNSPITVPVPDLTELLTQIELEMIWEPTLPPQYVRLAAPLAAPIVPGAPAAARQPPAARVPPPLLHQLLMAPGPTPRFQIRVILRRTVAVFARSPFVERTETVLYRSNSKTVQKREESVQKRKDGKRCCGVVKVSYQTVTISRQAVRSTDGW
jgi:hypothetical protein